MHTTFNQLILLGAMGVALLGSCKRWDDHIALDDAQLNETLMQQIDARPELSTFDSYLKKTGMDKVISASKEYTVWAPDNDALKQLSADTVSDTAKLKAFLMNHISEGLYLTANLKDSVRIPMLNGKKLSYISGRLAGVSLAGADARAKNGALQTLTGYVAPRPSIWEYLQTHQNAYLESAFITALNYSAQDPSKAIIDSISSITGNPVYRPGTGIVVTNAYLARVADLASEDSLYTFVLLTNDGYQAARDRQKPFFKSTDPAITDSNACWNVVKDLAFPGVAAPGALPDSLISRFGVHVPIARDAIVDSVQASNGIIYIVNSALCRLDEKIPVCYVEGETPFGFSKSGDDFLAKVFYRQRMNALTGIPFSDIYLNLGSGGANTFIDYHTNGLYTTKYKVYWVALNDMVISGQGDGSYGTDSSLQQILQIGTVKDTIFTTDFNVQQQVPPNDYQEVYLGEYTNDSYDWQLSWPLVTTDGTDNTINPATRTLRLLAPATAGSGIPLNLTLDYVKLVPEF